MNVKARIIFKYQKPEHAETVFKSLQPDSAGFINSRREGKCFICNLDSDSAGTLRATADDLIFCEMVAERTLEFREKSI